MKPKEDDEDTSTQNGDPLLRLLLCDRVRSNKLLALNVVSLDAEGATDTLRIATRYRIPMFSSWANSPYGEDMDMERKIESQNSISTIDRE
jgi:hypothetical protein